MLSSRAYPQHFILQDVAQSIDAVNADIGNRSAAGHRGIMDPCARVSVPAGKENSDRAKTILPICPAATRSRKRAVLSSKRKTWATPSSKPALARRFHHLAALVRVDAHGFFAQHRFAAAKGQQHVAEMAGIRSGDKHGINFGRPAQIFRRIERQRDIVLPSGIRALSPCCVVTAR